MERNLQGSELDRILLESGSGSDSENDIQFKVHRIVERDYDTELEPTIEPLFVDRCTQ